MSAKFLSCALVTASMALSGQALAQGSAAPPPAPAPAPAPAPDNATDHSLAVSHFGASYFGQFQVPFGTLASNAATQIVGIRYWTSDSMALDLGLGFLTSSGSTKSGNTTTDNPSRWGFSLKAGVPIALMSAKHYTFFFEPQAIVGYASESIRPTGGDETKNTGYHVALGATAGAEIQFGFIGIPHLALDATLGLGLDIQSATTKTGNNPDTTSSSTGFGTAAFAAPWNIFNSNVAARYYF